MRDRLRRFLWHPITDMVVMVLIVASVGLMVFEVTLPPGHPLAPRLEGWATAITWIFVVELLGRLYVLQSLRRFLSGYWVDVLAVLPLLRPLRILRVLRLLRLFRAGLLMNRWFTRFESTFAQGYREYLVVVMLAATMILTGSMSLYILEGSTHPQLSSFRRTLWWATFTMMAGEPIGGEPMTPAGRFVQLAMMLGGMTVFALLTGVVSALMVRRLRRSLEGREMLIDDLEGHIVVCGWNRGGPTLVHELCRDPRYRDRAIVVIVGAEEEADLEIDYDEVDRERLYIVRKDYTRVQVLEEAGIRRAAKAILLADATGDRSDQDRDARTVLAALTIENLNEGIFTCVELLHQENAPPLRLAGVEEIVIATEYSGNIMAHASLNAGLVHLFDEILTSSYGNNFFKAQAPEAWEGRSFLEVFEETKRVHGAIVLGAERKDEAGAWRMIVNPQESFRFRGDERIIYLAPENVSFQT